MPSLAGGPLDGDSPASEKRKIPASRPDSRSIAGILGEKRGLGPLTRSHHVNMPECWPKFSDCRHWQGLARLGRRTHRVRNAADL